MSSAPSAPFVMHQAAFGFGNVVQNALPAPLVGCAVEAVHAGGDFVVLSQGLPLGSRINRGGFLAQYPAFNTCACAVQRFWYGFGRPRPSEQDTVSDAMEAANIGARYMLIGGRTVEARSWMTRAVDVAGGASDWAPDARGEYWPGSQFNIHDWPEAITRYHPDEVAGAVMLFGGDERGLQRYDRAIAAFVGMMETNPRPDGVWSHLSFESLRHSAAALGRARTFIRKGDALIDAALHDGNYGHLEMAKRCYETAAAELKSLLDDVVESGGWRIHYGVHMSTERVPQYEALLALRASASHYRDVARQRVELLEGRTG